MIHGPKEGIYFRSFFSAMDIRPQTAANQRSSFASASPTLSRAFRGRWSKELENRELMAL